MFVRYAIYFTPTDRLAEFGAHWLGWDIANGVAMPHPEIHKLDIATITATPRKYGFHGTIKPPFRLADGYTVEMLKHALGSLCQTLVPVQLDGLILSRIGQFVALVPQGDQTALAALAAHVVEQMDRFRARPTDAELARRRKANLTHVQHQHLVDWGYPYVMDQFRFHMTLTGPLDEQAVTATMSALDPYVAEILPAPFEVASLTLVGEDAEGAFHEIHRYTLTG